MELNKNTVMKIFILIFIICSVNPLMFTERAKKRIIKVSIMAVHKRVYGKQFWKQTEGTVFIAVDDVDEEVILIRGRLFLICSYETIHEKVLHGDEFDYYEVEYWRLLGWHAYVRFKFNKMTESEGYVFTESSPVRLYNILGHWLYF